VCCGCRNQSFSFDPASEAVYESELGSDRIHREIMHHLIIPHHSHLQTPPSEEEDPLDALDRVREILADGDHPFPVDRKTLKEVMRNKMGQDVVRIKFLSSGAFIRLSGAASAHSSV